MNIRYLFSCTKKVPRTLRIVIFIPGFLFLFAACATPFNETPSSLSGHIKVDGSTALQPLTTKAAGLFMQLYPQVRIDVGGGGSLTGLDDVTSGKVSIGDSDVYADPATYPDPDLTDHLVCVVPFTIAVSTDVPVKNLTKEQIIGIFATGEYTNWDQIVPGYHEPILAIVRPPKSGTRATFRRYVLDGRDELNGLLTIDSSQDILAEMAQSRGAISYLGASFQNPRVQAVSINGYAATQANIESGKYVYWSYEHMYTLNTLNQPNGSLIDAFLNFMLTPQVQQQAIALNYLAISDLKFHLLSSQAPTGMLTSPYFVEESKRYYR